MLIKKQFILNILSILLKFPSVSSVAKFLNESNKTRSGAGGKTRILSPS